MKFLILIYSLFLILLGSWEAYILIKNNINGQVYIFIIIKLLLNIILGIYCFLLSLYLIFINNELDKFNIINKILIIINFGINMWGVILFYISQCKEPLKQILLIEMIYFYIIYGTISTIFILACCFVYIIVLISDKSLNKQIKNVVIEV